MSYFKLIFGDQCCDYALSQCLTWQLLYTTASSILGYTSETPFRLTFYCMKTWKMVELDQNVFNGEQNPFQRQNVKPVSIYVTKDDFQARQTLRTGVEVSHSSGDYSDTFSYMGVALMETTDQSSSSINELLAQDMYICTQNNHPSETVLGYGQYEAFGSTHIPSSVDQQRHQDVFETETQLIATADRLKFDLDVQAYQKPAHISDEFSQSKAGKKNGSIPFLQGVKTDMAKFASKLPILHIPSRYLIQTAILRVYAVTDNVDEELHTFYKDLNKEFLPIDYTVESIPSNPIDITITENDVQASKFILRLKMITSWKKLVEPERLLVLPKKSVETMHPSSWEPNQTRLLCRIINAWSTSLDICLSDYIRPRRKSGLSQTKKVMLSTV